LSDNTTAQLQQLIDRLRAGDDFARWELLERAHNRLRGVASKILEDFPRLHTEDCLWQTTEVAGEIRLRLSEALKEIQLNDTQHFFRVAAKKIRWFLLDLVRRLPPNEAADLANPSPALFTRSEYQDVITNLLELLPGLPEDEYAVLDLEFSLSFSVPEIAAVLDINEKTVRQRRRRAYEAIAKQLDSKVPGLGEKLGSGRD
jgi:RNA polymerase sigma factor (sigma-70 family)